MGANRVEGDREWPEAKATEAKERAAAKAVQRRNSRQTGSPSNSRTDERRLSWRRTDLGRSTVRFTSKDSVVERSRARSAKRNSAIEECTLILYRWNESRRLRGETRRGGSRAMAEQGRTVSYAFRVTESEMQSQSANTPQYRCKNDEDDGNGAEDALNGGQIESGSKALSRDSSVCY
jgi:hypothetical protein